MGLKIRHSTTCFVCFIKLTTCFGLCFRPSSGHEIYILFYFIFDGNCKTMDKEMYIDIFRRPRDAVKRKRPKNGENTVRSPLTTMLQRTGRFRSRISYQRTMWQHWNILHTVLAWLQLIFTCSLDWNQHWWGGAFVMTLTSLRMQRKSWKGLHKMVSRNIYNAFTVAGKVCSCTKELFRRNCSLYDALLIISQK
jgi:hypothetical protein